MVVDANAPRNSASAASISSRWPRRASRRSPTASSPARGGRSTGRPAPRLQGMPTFAKAADRLIDQKRPGWRNAREARHWRNSLARYVFLRIGTRPVAEIASADVLAILTPIWHAQAPTAKVVRQLNRRGAGVGRGHGVPPRQTRVTGSAGCWAPSARSCSTCGRCRTARSPRLWRRPRLDGVARREARVRVSGADGGALRRGTAGDVGRDRSPVPDVDHPGVADESATRAPGAAVRSSRRDPPRRRRLMDDWDCYLSHCV